MSSHASSVPRPPRRVDPRFLAESGIIGLTGNELLVKGALEGGIALLTGYPGSPISGVFETVETIAPYLQDIGVVAQIANNEALAAARLSGACQTGLRAMAVMKSVGFHVASDALATGNLVEFRRPEGGGLVVTGDDPWNESTQVNSDSRYLSMHLNMPVIEPATLQEIKDFVGAAFELSGASDLLLTMVITTNQADGGGTVTARPNVPPAVNAVHRGRLASDGVTTGDVIMIPPFITMREASLAERYRRLHARSRELKLDRRRGPAGRAPVGFVTSGLSYTYLEKVLQLAGIREQVPVLKLGVTYPVDADAVLSFAADVDRLIVVEEKRGFLEAQIGQAIAEGARSGRLAKPPEVWGKRFADGRPGFPNVGGLNPSVVLEVLGPEMVKWAGWFPALDAARIEERLEIVRETGRGAAAIPRRTPTFCPGCPHRDSAVVALDLKRKLKNEVPARGAGPIDVVVHGESGCHTMLGFAPFSELMQNYVGMGLGGGAGAGMGPFVDNKHLVFMGDSTFFHSGIVAISDAIKNDQDITFVILENKTTAMTGHQPTAGTTADIMGRPTRSQDIERIVRGMAHGGVQVTRLDPAQREAYERIIAASVRSAGVKVIIADKECAITLHRRENAQKKRQLSERGFLPREDRLGIDQEVCDNCLECVRQTACPGLSVVETPLGPKIGTDVSTCVDDGACARTRACPSFAKITIRRRAPAAPTAPSADGPVLPPPPSSTVADAWSVYVGGVGGMGIGVLTGILARAGEYDGLHAHFVTRNGLAIRNGGVYGHVVLSRAEPPDSPFGFYGDADLLLGVDLLEGCRGVHPAGNLRVAHPGRTKAVVNLNRHQTVLSQAGQDTLDVDALAGLLRGRTRGDAGVFADFSRIAETELGSRVYANVMVIGVAFQKGWIPLTESSLVRSIGENVRSADRAANLRAFQRGRALAAAPPDEVTERAVPERLEDTVAARAALIEREAGGGAAKAAGYRRLALAAAEEFGLADGDRTYAAHALADLVRYGGIGHAERYLAVVRRIRAADSLDRDLRATKAALRSIFRLMTPKDEFWVARLLTSPEKVERDRRRYAVDPARGDSLRYAFLMRPMVRLFGRTIEIPIAARPWMLRIVAACSSLRPLLRERNRPESEFLAWFLATVDEALPVHDDRDYDVLVKILESGGLVLGFRDVRRRAMVEARRTIGSLRGSVDRASVPT